MRHPVLALTKIRLLTENFFQGEGEQFLSSTGMAFGLERNVFHRGEPQ